MPGHLLKAIKRQATKAETPLGSTTSVHRRLATKARLEHKSSEADRNEVQSRLQQKASTPDGPAAPLVRRAARRMAAPSKASKMTG